MADDEFGADADFLAALAATDVGSIGGTPNSTTTTASSSAPRPPAVTRPLPPHLANPQTPVTPRIQQPTVQRIQRPGAGNGSTTTPRIVQPTPQALSGPPGSSTPGAGAGAGTGTSTGTGTGTNATATRVAARPVSMGSTILVSPRQKGNPVLAQLRSVPWEYSDIVADYQLGVTTCALFLSLKYHRLHPEYIFARFRRLQGRFKLRVLLTLVDIENHEDPLRELSKTSLVNDLTLILCWSVAEAARYLELYKSFEHASNFAAIRGQQAAGYAERLVQFATVPRAINKSDAVALVGSFGSLRNAVLADAEQLGLVSGWGEKKVQAWRRAVDAPFRVQKGARRPRAKAQLGGTQSQSQTQTQTQTQKQTQKQKTAEVDADATQEEIEETEEEGTDFDAVFNGRLQNHQGEAKSLPTPQPTLTPAASAPPLSSASSPDKSAPSAPQEPLPTPAPEPVPQRPPEDTLSEGIAAALAKLRK